MKKTTAQLRESIAGGRYDGLFAELYLTGAKRQKERYLSALTKFEELFGSERSAIIVSAPGRCELSGNHTDHQNGRVLAAAVTVDNIAVASPCEERVINMHSEGYNPDAVNIDNLHIVDEEANTSSALIRGIAAWFFKHGFNVGGFDAYNTSDVPKGSGLSSSACFEVLVGNILSGLFNESVVGPVDVARAGRFAENIYFKKPSGFMDQIACSVGGVISIDFRDTEAPEITEVDSSALYRDFVIVVVNTGDSHADLSDLYAAIPKEMRQVAAFFGKTLLREVEEDLFYNNLKQLRGAVPDRAILRAHHFFSENTRVKRQITALMHSDTALFTELARESGRSSAIYLQNIYPENSVTERALPLALAVSEKILGDKGAFRVHGGGFAGTILSVVPCGLTDEYVFEMQTLFGANCCYRLAIRPRGGYCIIE